MSDMTDQDFPPGYLEETRQPRMYITCGVFIALSTIAVALRFFARRLARIPWQHDDTLMLLGWMFFIGLASTVIADVHSSGIGLHQAQVMMIDPKMLQLWAKYLLAVSYLYVTSVMLPKLAILSMYVSIFGKCRVFRITCYVTGGIVIANFVASAASGFAICIPLKYLWDKSISGKCFDINAWFRWSRLVNIISDAVLLLLPIPYILRLQMETRLKLGVLITFSFGALGLVAAILTLTMVSKTDATEDKTWSGVDMMFWAVFEAGIYIIAPCLLSYQPLAKYIWQNVLKQETSADLSNYSKTGTGITSGIKVPDDGIALVEVERRGSEASKMPHQGDIVVERGFAVQ